MNNLNISALLKSFIIEIKKMGLELFLFGGAKTDKVTDNIA